MAEAALSLFFVGVGIGSSEAYLWPGFALRLPDFAFIGVVLPAGLRSGRAGFELLAGALLGFCVLRFIAIGTFLSMRMGWRYLRAVPVLSRPRS